MFNLLNRIKGLTLDILFPRVCIGCSKEGKYICQKCEVFLSELENTIPGLVNIWEYEGLVEKAIWKIKFDGCYDIINELVEKSFQKIELNLPADTYITYVPMYKNREKQRGFNQAEVIAKKIGGIKGLPAVRLLEKVKDNRTQVGLGPKERVENVKGVFKLAEAEPRITEAQPRPPLFLVDDVYTTGATMAECKKVLRKAGFKNVLGFTIARKLNL